MEQQTYFGNKTFIVCLESKKHRVSVTEFVSEGSTNPRLFHEWIKEQMKIADKKANQENDPFIITYATVV